MLTVLGGQNVNDKQMQLTYGLKGLTSFDSLPKRSTLTIFCVTMCRASPISWLT